MDGPSKGGKVEIKGEEYRALGDEAKAVWGKEDEATGKFVPGLLVPRLQVEEPVP